MSRLQPLLASDSGEAEFSARFYLDQEKRPWIEMQVKADLPLICQVSLAPYTEPVRRSSQLVVLEQATEEGLLPEGSEAVLATSGRCGFKALVEDELLLALPLVPRNPQLEQFEFQTRDHEQQEFTGDESSSAFAALAELKSTRDRN